MYTRSRILDTKERMLYSDSKENLPTIQYLVAVGSTLCFVLTHVSLLPGTASLPIPSFCRANMTDNNRDKHTASKHIYPRNY